MTNLVRNAIQAMPKGGRLRFRVVREDGSAVFEIGDTGVGIAHEALEKVFEPLYTSKARGIGLGLSVAKRYAELNDGRLEVSSTLGEGSTFRLTLPLDQSANI